MRVPRHSSMKKGHRMSQRIQDVLGWLAVIVVALAGLILLPSTDHSPTTDTAAAAVCTDSQSTHRRMKPYKCEREKGRYPSDSDGGIKSVPCSTPKPWPSGVLSCFGPEAPVPPAKSATAAKPAAPAAPPRKAAPHATKAADQSPPPHPRKQAHSTSPGCG